MNYVTYDQSLFIKTPLMYVPTDDVLPCPNAVTIARLCLES